MSPDDVYKIEELPFDERILVGSKHRISFYRVTRAAIWIALLYLTARLYFLLTSPEPTWRMWTMFVIECLFSHMSYQHQALSLSATASPSHLPRKRLRLRNSHVLPTVDVLITCCGESPDIILSTVVAACLLDYPTSHFRVRVLDDGASTELRDEILKLSVKWNHLTYHTRGKQSNQSFAKAGNLNYALFSLQTEDPPEFCTVVDADSILLPHFLRATLPHLLEDPQAALLTTRQYFDNLPRGDPLSQSRSYFYNCENTELDLIGHAVDAGSGAVFRRDAILEAGGYPTFSFSEDWQLSLILRGMKKRTVQVQEVLQFGLVPTSLAAHVKQRNRWHIGHSQQISLLFSPSENPVPKDLRWDIAAGGLSIMTGLAIYVIGFLAVPVLLSFNNGGFIPSQSSFEVKLQYVLASLHVSFTWTYNWSRSKHAGVPFVPFAHTENSWLAAAHLYAVIQFHSFGSKPKGSFVTGSAANRSEDTQPVSLAARSYQDVLANGLWLNLCLFIAIWARILIAIQLLSCSHGDVTGRLLETMVTTIFWPPFLILMLSAISNNWVPIQYLLTTPVYHARSSPLIAVEDRVSSMKETIPPLGCEPSIVGRACAVGLPVIIIGLAAAMLAL
ncbi:CAZyme family GT2 [Penicillium brevicompactum]|uniref:CAZyme family GT2 n=1 Tax=Penicillium brevicompactum TaxID=5074 RepID=UPI0025419AC8|nr:CAZyme family GT2 [Penicillium brevicompactum]KAJ5336199.1 CAZyme family GT2 [Penicillium brevicompactum]